MKSTLNQAELVTARDGHTHTSKSITAEIWHGEYRNKITVVGDSIREALKKLGEASCYCAETETQVAKVEAQLNQFGIGDLGWVKYSLNQ
jgi:hypothetical protein